MHSLSNGPSRPEVHSLLLGAALTAFRDEINSTGQTLPFDSGKAVATIHRNTHGLWVGLQTDERSTVLSLELREGAGGMLSLTQPITLRRASTAMGTPNIPGIWYRLPDGPIGASALLALTTERRRG